MQSDENFLVWRLERYFEVLLPCPLAAVERLLPPGVRALEPSPGRALLSVGCLRFHAGNLGELPAFDELTVAISIVSPAPARHSDFDFMAVSICSPCARFLELAAEVDKMPTTPCPGLRFSWSERGERVAVVDDAGPIVELALLDEAPSSALELQAHSLQARADGVWLSRVRWAGRGSLVPLPQCSVQVHPHPFWGSFPLADLERAPMMALVAGPGEHTISFAQPQPWP